MTALFAVAAIGACSNSATKEAAPSSAVSQSQTTVSPQASPQAAAHNKADMMFANMMIPHHQQAIEMSDLILGKQDVDPRVVEMATQIKAAQDPEIQQMQGWLDAWNMDMNDMPGDGGMGDMPGHGGMGDMPGMGGMGGMDGMLSEAEMQALREAQGAEANKLFLTGMIKHHEGAITMAQNEIKNGEFPEAIELSKAIVESQQKEIDTMNEILKTL
jgi:uncharacterized protein (DUF305 family)